MSTWMMIRGEGAGPTAGLRRWSAEPEAWRDRGQCADDEGDVLVEIDPELLAAPVHVVAVHGASEALVLELLLDRAGLEAGDGTPGPHEGAGRDEAGQLVTGVQGPVELRHAREPRVVGVGQDRVDDLGRGPARPEDLRALHGMVRRGRVHLVVEVVEHAGDAPRLGIAAVALRVGAHGCFDGERVLAKTVRLREFGEEGPGPCPVHQAPLRVRHLSMDFLEKSHWPSCSRAGMRRSAASRVSASASMERYVEASLTVIVSLGITCQRPP